MDINTSTYNKRSDVYLIRRVQVKGQEIRDLSGRLEKEAFWRKVNMDSIHDMTLADVKVAVLSGNLARIMSHLAEDQSKEGHLWDSDRTDKALLQFAQIPEGGLRIIAGSGIEEIALADPYLTGSRSDMGVAKGVYIQPTHPPPPYSRVASATE